MRWMRWHHDRVDVPVTLAEAATLLQPPMTEPQLRAIIRALGWQPVRHPRGGRGHHATYPWPAISALHQALLPFLQETRYGLSGPVWPDEVKWGMPDYGK